MIEPATPSERLVDHALGLQWTSVPASVRLAARTFLHDTLCVGAAGRNAAQADAVLAVARQWGDGDAAGVLGRPGTRLPAASAAFVNAFQIHGQEYDCVHEPAVLHPMATVVAALLAEAERGAPVDGEQFLTAVIAGVDVAVTLGLAAPGPLRFFRPATAGIFGCVAAIATLRRLPRGVARDAWGHALAFASGTMQAHVEGKPALPLQVANAARSSLVAIDLARAGMPGIRRPLEGPFGYFALMEERETLGAAVDALRDGHRIVEVSWKPFPTGRAAHGGIVAVQQLMRDHDIGADVIDQLEYRAPPLINRLVGRPALPGMEPGYARLCLPWLMAVTLTRGRVALGDFVPELLHDPSLLALAQRMQVTIDENCDPAAFVPAVAIARMRDGRIARAEVTAQFGAPEWPLTGQQHRNKAQDCLRFAGIEGVHAPLCQLMDRFDALPDVLAAFRSAGLIG